MTQVSSSYSQILSRYKNLISQTPREEEKTESSDGGFGQLITQQLEKLNQSQLESDSLIAQFAAGETEDLHQVMIAAEEARLQMELTVQVRNKIVEAYKELNSMQF